MNQDFLPGHTDVEIMALARRANQSIFWRTCAILSIVATGIVGFIAGNAAQDAAQATRDVKATQVAGCEASTKKNGIRYIDADNIQRQQDRNDALHFDPVRVAASFGITVAQLQATQEAQRRDVHEQVQALLDVDCSSGRAVPRNTPGWKPPASLGEQVAKP